MNKHRHKPRPTDLFGIVIDALASVANEIKTQGAGEPPFDSPMVDFTPFGMSAKTATKRVKKAPKRSYLAAFDLVVIPPNSTAQIPTKMQVPFRVDGIYVIGRLHPTGVDTPFPKQGTVFTNESMDARHASNAPESDEETARFLSVMDFRVGKNSQFMNATPVPVPAYNIAFTSGRKLRFDLAPTGCDIRIDLHNESSVPISAHVMMSGTTDD